MFVRTQGWYCFLGIFLSRAEDIRRSVIIKNLKDRLEIGNKKAMYKRTSLDRDLKSQRAVM